MEELYYKDCSLEETIENVRRALDEAGIDVEESFMQGAEGAFSVRLEIKGLGLGTNGKGVTKEAALASAYGEFMERIQQFALYKFTYPVNDMSDYPFCYYPDEVKIPIDKLGEYCSVFGEAYSADTSKVEELLSKTEREEKVFCALKYKNLFDESETLIPAGLAEYIYASNGMAAGNTLNEALVQGLSELFERFANKQILVNNIVPPLIPMDKLRLSEKAQNIIEKLSQKNYEIQFRDCSMGIGLPVIGMTFIDKTCGKYFVKFGSHPVMEVAIDRTLTELFQGRKLLSAVSWMQSFSFEDIKDAKRNFETIFRSGDGKYPSEIFSEKESYEYTDCWYKGEFHDNAELLRYCTDIVRKNNWSILYKEFNFLELVSIHIIIPEMSYVTVFDNAYAEKQSLYKSVQNDARNIDECNTEQKKRIIRFLENNYYSPSDSIALLYTLPLDSGTELQNCSAEFYKYLLYASMDENEKALNALDRFIKDGGVKDRNKKTYYKCLRELFYAIKIKGVSHKSAFVTAASVFDQNIVDEVKEDVNNQEEKLRKYTYACTNAEHCNGCRIHDECRYPRIIDIHRKLAELCVRRWEKSYE